MASEEEHSFRFPITERQTDRTGCTILFGWDVMKYAWFIIVLNVTAYMQNKTTQRNKTKHKKDDS